YQFVQDGLRHTVRQVLDQRASDPGLQSLGHGEHVTGQQLCVGLRDFAIERDGMLASAVLAAWGLHRTEAFGRMVFALIEAGAMSKTPHDTIEDFCGVYDFEEAFHREHAVAAIRAPAV
ncbi:MAG: Minf_1886 family protein, partial [Phycisphaerales bacterium]